MPRQTPKEVMMRNSNKNKDLRDRNALRTAAAVSLAVFLAGVGACTTNRTPGAGEPTGYRGIGSSRSPSSTPGSSSGTQGVKPTTSSMQLPAPMYSSSAEAIAVLASNLPRERYLGPADPGGAPGIVISGRSPSPALIANPQATVNSSISSAPTPVITSGAGAGTSDGLFILETAAGLAGTTSASTATPTSASAGTVSPTPGAVSGAVSVPTLATGNSVTTPVTGAVVSNGSTASVIGGVVNSDHAAPVITTPATAVTPASAAIPVTSGVFAAGPGLRATAISNGVSTASVSATPVAASSISNGTSVIANQNSGLLTPTVSSSLNPSPTLAANPPVGTATQTAQTNGVTSAATTNSVSTQTITGSAGVRVGHGISVPAGVSAAAIMENLQAQATAPVTSTSVRGRVVARPSTARVRPVTAPSTTSDHMARPLRVSTSQTGTVTVTNQ
jgi:collagen type VII alpha